MGARMEERTELLTRLKEVDRLSKISDSLEHQGRIAEYRVIYGQMWRLATEVSEAICQILGGRITYNEALRMVIHQNNTILEAVTASI